MTNYTFTSYDRLSGTYARLGKQAFSQSNKSFQIPISKEDQITFVSKTQILDIINQNALIKRYYELIIKELNRQIMLVFRNDTSLKRKDIIITIPINITLLNDNLHNICLDVQKFFSQEDINNNKWNISFKIEGVKIYFSIE